MIEIYLFVNPLGPVCLDAEHHLLDFVEKSDKKIQFRVLPLVNMNTISDIMARNGLENNDMTKRNTLVENTYSAALDCKAIQLQGKKRARDFMMRLQDAVGCQKQPYTKELVAELVTAVGGDVPMFWEDRQSALVKNLFQTDQSIAREMKIKLHPSAVVYNYACDRDYGVLLEGIDALQDLPKLCLTTEENYQIFHIDGYLQQAHERRVHHNARHLKLM